MSLVSILIAKKIIRHCTVIECSLNSLKNSKSYLEWFHSSCIFPCFVSGDISRYTVREKKVAYNNKQIDNQLNKWKTQIANKHEKHIN